MLRITELRLPLDHAEGDLRSAVLARLGLAAAQHVVHVFRRAYDARKKSAIQLIYTLDCEVDDEAAVLQRLAGDPHIKPSPDTAAAAGGGGLRPLRPVRRADPGADGLAADRAGARQGGARAHQDTWGLWRKGVLNPESNVQFGEGGAGTFSDGKLWSQIKDPRHLTRKVLTEFVKAGAPEEILYVSKPHIGTFRW
jgi:uncharacterized FAD-dependent dehydrogenase